jgi:hypothetical protein
MALNKTQEPLHLIHLHIHPVVFRLYLFIYVSFVSSSLLAVLFFVLMSQESPLSRLN